MAEVTDQGILSQLNGGEITDPDLLRQLNGTSATSSVPTQYDATTPYDAALGATHPVTAELEQGLGNAAIGAGALYTDAGLRLHQLYNAITGGPSLDAEVAEKRRMDAPINATYGGMLGKVAGAAPGAVLAGPSIAGAALYGGAVGAMQPSMSTDTGGNLGSTAINTGIGAGSSALAAGLGKGIASWATQRAAQPLLGYTPESTDAILARTLGAENLTGPSLGARAAELGATYQAGRNAATSVDLSSTPQALDQILSDLNPSARALVESNPNVADLTAHATGVGSSNGQSLGRISTGLRQDASTALNSEGGNREVGLALQQVRNHVEGLIQSSIPDPTLATAYASAGPQYGLLQDVRYNPSLVNAATGRANMEALGKYLQRNNPAYTSAAAGDNDLFRAAAWGQAGGGAKGAPSFNLGTPWKLPLYALTNNPVARASGGIASRALAPMAPAIPRGFAGISYGTSPVLLPYIEQ